jgi:hypothetical protein
MKIAARDVTSRPSRRSNGNSMSLSRERLHALDKCDDKRHSGPDVTNEEGL